ncbi:hypothetical protein HPB50_006848 [Hyalomma asiaticum]|uniref:Uncharacterized protein n=1 Tax=Hyalomma asiaticum TaxID=266040 RepID=A0ACB7SNU2_HYAAI|nr:hypothetical protein HPB50_006848 [Hyalomma asiaticum]
MDKLRPGWTVVRHNLAVTKTEGLHNTTLRRDLSVNGVRLIDMVTPSEGDQLMSPQRFIFSGSGSSPAVMSPKFAWLVLQILPLTVTFDASSGQSSVPHNNFSALRFRADDVIWPRKWASSGGGTSPDLDPIKQSPQRFTFSGSGSSPAVMSPKFAWFVLQRLPATVRIGVTASGETDVFKIAKVADRLMAITMPAVAAVLAEALPSPALLEIRKGISHLAETIAALQASGSQRTPWRAAQHRQLCWYHCKFGDTARKCVPLCEKSGNAPSQH